MTGIKWTRKKKVITTIISGLLIWFAFCLPSELFNDPLSTVLNDRDNRLIAASIASDGQWRFPQNDSIPRKFREAIVYFEDEYFFYHPGVNPVSMVKAIVQNIKAGKIVRGGSTLAVQTIRMSRKGQARTYLEKIIESIQALRLELRLSKQEILSLYSSNAPFGGNVVGLEAASWRYYGRPPHQLSWGETTALAVLPNAPALIYPGRNQDLLRAKRDRLLDKLQANNIIDSLTCLLAKDEPLPQKPKPLPQLTEHLLTRSVAEGKNEQRIKTTIDSKIQQQAVQVIEKHHRILKENEIANAAAIIVNAKTGEVLAYVGNTKKENEYHGNDVDIITAKRSSGSILKPFLYAFMQKEGQLLPNMLVPDIPTQFAGYTPKNFDKKYDGAVPADNALARSLNIPAVRMLRDYGIEKFCQQLKDLGFSSIDKSAGHYGLSLILGGAEVRLWDLANVYSKMSKSLTTYNESGESASYSDISWALNPSNKKSSSKSLLDPGSTWLAFEALTEMDRPVEGTQWNNFSSSKKIAWKTGTSFGFRDAWSVGVTPDYVVGVWVGNADGEGRPELTGARSAAPILFDIFKFLPGNEWFEAPFEDMLEVPVCANSGYKASINCGKIDTVLVSKAATKAQTCPFHKLIHLNTEETRQVNGDCYRVSDMVTKPWFILPPVMEWYYKSKDPYYKILPRYAAGCNPVESNNMALIYPKVAAEIFIPKGFDQKKERVVFEAAHRVPNSVIYWHLDEQFLGSTSSIHQMEIETKEGPHSVTLVSEDGEILTRSFTVISK